MRKVFGRQELDAALNAIAGHLKRSVTCYLIGGCAMTFRGQKVATKDIDLVVLGSEDLEALVAAMETAGFIGVPDPGEEYRELGAMTTMEDPSGMRFDLFQQVVSRKLAFIPSMQRRSTEEATFGTLTLRLASAEDIFLFKGVTDRPDDLDDMSVLAAGGVGWGALKEGGLFQGARRPRGPPLVGKAG